MGIEGVDILESDIAIAAAELGSMHLRPEMLFERCLAIKCAVALSTEAVTGKNAMVSQNVIALAFLVTMTAELDSNRILGNRRVIAMRATSMCGEVSTSSSMFFQVDCVAIGATTKAVEGEV